MKRLLRVIGILLLITVSAMLLLPIIFKDEIIDRAKIELNNNLYAKLEFSDINLSLFKSFPDFTLSIHDITVDGIEEFEDIRLAEIGEFRLDLDLMSVLSGNEIKIEKVAVSDADLYLLVNQQGVSNYNIIKSSEESEGSAATDESASFSLKLKNYQFNDLNLLYKDQEGDILVELKHLYHEGKGDFTENMVNLVTTTRLKSLNVSYEGVKYMSSVEAEMEADFMYDQNSLALTFGDNLLILNDLPLEFTGAVSLPEDKIVMDLSFHSPSEDISKILSLIPAIYAQGIDDLESSGSFKFSGFAKGEYDYEDHYPAYDFDLLLQNGSFKYPDLPASVDGINITARLFNTSSKLEGLEIAIPEARANIAGNPIEAKLELSNSMTNPTFDFALKADFDMVSLTRVVSMPGYNLGGKMAADMKMAADLEAVEQERYGDIAAEGFVNIDGLRVAGDSMPQPLIVDKAMIELRPQYIDIQEFTTVLGSSDFRLSGRLDNILAYLIKDETLIGSFDLSSDMINLNELSTSEEEENLSDGNNDSDTAIGVVRLPQNINFSLNTSVRQLVYDNLMITDVLGRVSITKGIARLTQLDMRLLGGKLRASGLYNSKVDLPLVDMSFDMRDFDIRESYQKLGSIRELAPIMKNSTGKFSTNVNFRANLERDMSPNLESINASGALSTQGVSTSPKVLQKLSDIVKSPKLSVLPIEDVRINYRIENGRIETDPFTLTSGSFKSVVSGSMGLDKSLDYTMDVSLPLKDIGAANLLSQLGSDPNQKIDLKVLIGGTSSNPTLSTSLKDLGSSIIDEAVNEVTKKVEEVVDDAKDQVNAKAAELVSEAEKKGDELIAEAQRQGDALVSEAENQAAKLRSEANKQARKLEDEAKGNFLAEKAAKVAADKIRDEADKKATQLVEEARKQANKLVEQARQQKVKLVEEAQEKARIQ